MDSLKKNRHLVGTLVAIVLCGLYSTAFAAGMPATAPTSSAVIVADVNIRDAKLTMNGNSAVVSFSLQNGTGAQPDIRYAIVAIPVASTTGEQDEYISSEAISLSQNESIAKTVTYTPPPFISGKYTLWVSAQTGSGMPLGVAFAGETTFSASEKNHADILFPTCYLTASGDASTTKYVPQQGVDVLPTETLSVHCDVQSYFSVAQAVLPHFETRYRTEFGDSVETAPASATGYSLGSSERKALIFTVPTPQTPQSYEALLTLTDSAGAALSNTITFHYVVDGASATIQNAVLDKDQYSKGDTAHVSLTWTPSADSFPGARHGTAAGAALSLEVGLSDRAGQKCADTVTQQIEPQGNAFVVPLAILSTCTNPALNVSLRDGKGTLLASKTYAIATMPEKTQQTSVAVPTWLWWTLGGVLLAVIILVVGTIMWRRKRNQNSAPGQYPI